MKNPLQNIAMWCKIYLKLNLRKSVKGTLLCKIHKEKGAAAMEVMDKLRILADSAKYDVACTSSGADRGGRKAAIRDGGGFGSAQASGICHTFTGDGRCVSLLKILMSNMCVFDCQYCVNRTSNDVERATFTPEEIAELTMNFYKRNYIEGLFLSSAVIKNADHTTELMIRALSLLRNKYKFHGYIHAKAIPGADPILIRRLGTLCDRLSVNIELPSEKSLKLLAPDKTKTSILAPMGEISSGIAQNKNELALYKSAPRFAPAGQSTQMIVGATPETDKQIMALTEGLYKKFNLKRVFFSAYIPVGNALMLPNEKPPLLREHRLYQADWLLRFYGFKAGELLDDKNQNFDELLDPKCSWAVRNPQLFPVEINSASYEMLLRVPGIGVRSAKRIVRARRCGSLDFDRLKKMGVVLKRARFFIVCNGRYFENMKVNQYNIEENLKFLAAQKPDFRQNVNQLSMFDNPALLPPKSETIKSLTGEF